MIEYSDLAPELRDAREGDGRLRFRAGNVAIHVLSRTFVERICAGGDFQLPFHVARKEVPTIDADGAPVRIQGSKFETFVFDGLPLARQVLVLEVPRAGEFSPIKSRDGADSPAASRQAQIELFASWLEAAGVEVPRDADGRSVHAVEISPLFADGPLAVRERRSGLPDRVDGDLVLG